MESRTVKTFFLRCLSALGWLIYLLDDPSIIMKIGLCQCGHKELQHSNDDSKQCLACNPASRCPGFLLFQKPNYAESGVSAAEVER